MAFTPPLSVGDLRNGWRSLAQHLTADQVEHLSAMERHPAYAFRPGFLLLEALELVQPGWAAEYAAALAVT
ncbi:Uncharacterised protein [Mycolicibacterium vanbaalenii]|uniref:Uncharacterized protein n=1 Tax=Mycolicibacterium vanbaalenii TaxID=110539 RepID=A0A5S9RAE9_MYCVN|nr:hypothetical protein [Mycolicibacterium vanbaalenii]CAA0136099.1 Uncharacterised protein [Mycolicibacterium vanbaalenii]